MRPALVIVGVLAVAPVTGCDWSLHRMQEQPKCTVNAATILLPNDQCNLVPPAGTVAWEPAPAGPPAVTRALIVRGQDRYDRFCAPCHGIPGDGDSAVARAMTVRRPPSLIDAAAASLSDDRILTVIESGYGLMPAYATLVLPADRYAILHYVRVLQQREVELGGLSPARRQEAKRWLR